MTNQALVWTEDLSVNLMMLDDQHIKLLQVIAYWWEKNKSGRIADKEVRKIFRFLTRFTQQHLQFEELVMETLVEMDAWSSNDFDAHKKYHRNFIDGVMAPFHLEMVSRNKNIVDSSQEYLKKVSGWWIPHIRGVDSKYAQRVAALPVEKKLRLYDSVVKAMLLRPILQLDYEGFLHRLSKKQG